MNNTPSPTLIPLKGILCAATLLVVLLCGRLPVHADTSSPSPDQAPITASQLSMTVQMDGVPQNQPKAADHSTTKVRSLTINVLRIGRCNGHLSLKVGFVGWDVAEKHKVLNVATDKDAEAIPGTGNVYTFTSDPFVFVPAHLDPKTKKPIPASGTKPLGWVVRVFQGDKLVTAQSSNADLIPWISQ